MYVENENPYFALKVEVKDINPLRVTMQVQDGASVIGNVVYSSRNSSNGIKYLG